MVVYPGAVGKPRGALAYPPPPITHTKVAGTHCWNALLSFMWIANALASLIVNIDDDQVFNVFFTECFDTNGPKCSIGGRDAYKKGQKFCSAMPCLLQVRSLFLI